ncbi:hypothetical protein F5148DRAFT_1372996 [Russula earlei]|uniref:Uncharacterized protein n=1 Tax=Russula earlei TaxID=71964 RepID=A0ACC0UNK5_9AGAM|nr:hypothetical protein F5148DRAFT_1372996 [Russula earlei]
MKMKGSRDHEIDTRAANDAGFALTKVDWFSFQSVRMVFRGFVVTSSIGPSPPLSSPRHTAADVSAISTSSDGVRAVLTGTGYDRRTVSRGRSGLGLRRSPGGGGVGDGGGFHVLFVVLGRRLDDLFDILVVLLLLQRGPVRHEVKVDRGQTFLRRRQTEAEHFRHGREGLRVASFLYNFSTLPVTIPLWYLLLLWTLLLAHAI